MIEIKFSYVDKKQDLIWNTERELVDTFSEVLEVLEEKELLNHKKEKLYHDVILPDGTIEVVHTGYVFHRWNYYEDSGKRYNEEIWVSLNSITIFNLGKVSTRNLTNT